MNTNTKTEGHKLLDRLLVVSLAKNREAGRIIADHIDELERENAALRAAIEHARGCFRESGDGRMPLNYATVCSILGRFHAAMRD